MYADLYKKLVYDGGNQHFKSSRKNKVRIAELKSKLQASKQLKKKKTNKEKLTFLFIRKSELDTSVACTTKKILEV